LGCDPMAVTLSHARGHDRRHSPIDHGVHYRRVDADLHRGRAPVDMD
jgi:hypothetical protein